MQSDHPSITTLTTSTYQPWQLQHLKSTNTLTNSARKAHPSFTRHLANGRLRLVVVYYVLTVITVNTINCSFKKLEKGRAWYILLLMLALEVSPFASHHYFLSPWIREERFSNMHTVHVLFLPFT